MRAKTLSATHKANIAKALTGLRNGVGNKGPLNQHWELSVDSKKNQSSGAKSRWQRYREDESLLVGGIRIDLRNKTNFNIKENLYVHTSDYREQPDCDRGNGKGRTGIFLLAESTMLYPLSNLQRVL